MPEHCTINMIIISYLCNLFQLIDYPLLNKLASFKGICPHLYQVPFYPYYQNNPAEYLPQRLENQKINNTVFKNQKYTPQNKLDLSAMSSFPFKERRPFKRLQSSEKTGRIVTKLDTYY